MSPTGPMTSIPNWSLQSQRGSASRCDLAHERDEPAEGGRPRDVKPDRCQSIGGSSNPLEFPASNRVRMRAVWCWRQDPAPLPLDVEGQSTGNDLSRQRRTVDALGT